MFVKIINLCYFLKLLLFIKDAKNITEILHFIIVKLNVHKMKLVFTFQNGYFNYKIQNCKCTRMKCL